MYLVVDLSSDAILPTDRLQFSRSRSDNTQHYYDLVFHYAMAHSRGFHYYGTFFLGSHHVFAGDHMKQEGTWKAIQMAPQHKFGVFALYRLRGGLEAAKVIHQARMADLPSSGLPVICSHTQAQLNTEGVKIMHQGADYWEGTAAGYDVQMAPTSRPPVFSETLPRKGLVWTTLSEGEDRD